MRRKWLRRSALTVVLLFVAIAAMTALSYSPGAPTINGADRLARIDLVIPFRTWEEHGALYPPGDDSYTLQIDEVDNQLLYFGSKHSRDRNHPQRKRIEKSWDEFKPTVALHEGRSRGYLIGPVYERLLGLPEPAIVHQLARRDDVPLYSLEPPYEHEIGELLKQWSPDRITLYFTMRVYWSEAQGRADDGLATDLLAKRTDTPSLRDALQSVADIDRLWKRDFPEMPSWRKLKTEPQDTYLDEISDASRLIRGRHMVRVLVDLARRGERVFAVVGCSHVIRHEPTIRDLLDTRAAE